MSWGAGKRGPFSLNFSLITIKAEFASGAVEDFFPGKVHPSLF